MCDSTQYALYAVERTLKHALELIAPEYPNGTPLASPGWDDDQEKVPLTFALKIVAALRMGQNIPEFVTDLLHEQLNEVGAAGEPEEFV